MELHDYQKYAVRFIEEHPIAALFLDMGLGKTITTLTAIHNLMFDLFTVRKVLIIAPLRVARDTWSAEIEKWEHLKPLRYSVAVGTEEERLAAIKADADIYIINRENLDWLVNNTKFDYGMVVIDELSSFKSHQSKRFKALMKVRPNVKRIVGLTGTPASNGLMDLWAEFRLLDMGQRLGRFIGQYRNAYFKPDKQNGYLVYSYKPLPDAERQIYEKIANIGKQTLHKESEEFNMKKKVLSVILAAVCTMGLMAGCGAEGSKGSTQSGAKGDSYTVGISQFAEHGSLDNCREGFLEGLKEEGIEEGKNLKVDYQNAQTDTGTASTIADSFVSEKVDMICAISTPCAASAYNSAMNADIPTVYTAVSDPVVAGLAKEDGSSVGNITGSSDVLPVEEQLKMIREMMPEAKKIGILYTTSEANSCSTIEEYKELADKYDFEIVDTGINTSADIEIAASDLVSKVDCLCNLTDNTVVNALQTVLDKANGAKIPVFGSEIEQVKSGCVASMGIDYYQLGIETGKMAAKILKGEEKASDTPFITASKAELYVNTAAADKIGMTLDADYIKDAAETFDKIEVK